MHCVRAVTAPSQPAVDDFHLRVSTALGKNAEVHGRTLWAFLQEVVRENAAGVQMLSGVQRRLLLEEIVAELRAALSDEADRDHLTQVIALVTRAQGETHTYIKFLGD